VCVQSACAVALYLVSRHEFSSFVLALCVAADDEDGDMALGRGLGIDVQWLTQSEQSG